MAKTKLDAGFVRMSAEGNSDFVERKTRAMLDHIGRTMYGTEGEAAPAPCQCAEKSPAVQENDGLQHDVVAIYDNAGIPSFMHRFRKMTNRELFGGSVTTHPAFIIGGEEYDEIYISVYENCMINGKPYSLPYREPVTNITEDEFAAACFSKGEGWHCLTAAEWGLLALESLRLGTLPHGNTEFGKWHGDESEHGVNVEGSYKTLTGSGPATWTHNHQCDGVHDLCGNIWEFARGARVLNGALQAAENNDAALPETDLTENGKGWQPVRENGGRPVHVSVYDGGVHFTTDTEINADYDGCRWGDVEIDCQSEAMKELALFVGEPEAYCYTDSTEGEYVQCRGGNWLGGAGAGVFDSNLNGPRSYVSTGFGGRSAFFVKH